MKNHLLHLFFLATLALSACEKNTPHHEPPQEPKNQEPIYENKKESSFKPEIIFPEEFELPFDFEAIAFNQDSNKSPTEVRAFVEILDASITDAQQKISKSLIEKGFSISKTNNEGGEITILFERIDGSTVRVKLTEEFLTPKVSPRATSTAHITWSGT